MNTFTKTILALAITAVPFSTFAEGRSLLTCRSMVDPTFSSIYKVEVAQLDVTFEGSYVVKVTRTEQGFPGPITMTVSKEATGRVSRDFANLSFDGGSLRVTRPLNGYLKGEMNYDEDRGIELSCWM